MRTQWLLFLLLLFAILVAVFALINTEPVTINYGLGTVQAQLILVILGSALSGAVIVGIYGIVRQYVLQRDLKKAQKALQVLEAERDSLVKEVGALRARLEQATHTQSSPEHKGETPSGSANASDNGA